MSATAGPGHGGSGRRDRCPAQREGAARAAPPFRSFLRGRLGDILRGLLRGLPIGLSLVLPGLAPVAAHAADDGPLPRLLAFQPPRDNARLLGDSVTYRALIAWPAGWEIDRDGLPSASREDRAVELRAHRVLPAPGACADGACRWLELDWQIFKGVRMVEDVPLPATPVRLRQGSRIAIVELPAARVAVAPQVPWERRRDWLDSMRPGWQARPYDTARPWGDAAAWLGVAAVSLLGWGWSSGRLLAPRARRPFAVAWRQVRARARARARDRSSPAGLAPSRGEVGTEDLRDWHGAFDQTAGETVFAADLARFFAAQPHFAPLAAPVGEMFEASRQLLYLAPGRAPAVSRQELAQLLQRLAELEFRPLARRGAPHAAPSSARSSPTPAAAGGPPPRPRAPHAGV